jgi:hypothetical protein
MVRDLRLQAPILACGNPLRLLEDTNGRWREMHSLTLPPRGAMPR